MTSSERVLMLKRTKVDDMKTIDIRTAIVDVFKDKSPHDMREFSGLSLERCVEIYQLFQSEVFLIRKVKKFMKKPKIENGG